MHRSRCTQLPELDCSIAPTEFAGHIDNFACFAAPGVVLLAWTDDESDPQVGEAWGDFG